MRRVMTDAMASAGALLALVTLLVVVDSRVRELVMLRVSGGHASEDVAAAGGQLHDLMGVILDVVNDAMRVHPMLSLFVVIATVLTVFMVRT